MFVISSQMHIKNQISILSISSSMKALSSSEFRKLRSTFRESKQHKYLTEVSLIADKESTAMFNVAGMQQLIPYLMGKPHQLGRRVFNIQRCIRTVDIDSVGDASHLTFFEMMGNWSLGDYFKKEAVSRSREFLTSPEYLGIDHRKIAVTVFEGDEATPRDDETAGYWKAAGITEDKLSYLPADNNRRSPGPVGPCGPDTEIFYRVGEADFPPLESNVKDDEDNWMEIWNNVFMEFYRDETGTLTKLSQQNVDTGMGFERLCKTLQGKETVYESDIFKPLIDIICRYTGAEYAQNQRRMRIVADHLRTVIVLVNDGAIASNVGPGYVLRMIIRRMYYNLMLIKEHSPEAYSQFIDDMIAEIAKSRELTMPNAIAQTIKEELSQFTKTIANGNKLLQTLIEKANGTLAGKDVFMLYDTYGFPVELTREIAKENTMLVDEAGFEIAMEEAREKSRQGTKDMFKKGTDWSKYLEGVSATQFVGYEELEIENPKLIKDLNIDGQRVLIFDKTPFYAESGGQTGDKGTITLDDGTTVTIQDVKKYEGVFLHFVK
ncbi:MAG: alanine--tRNA ligase [Candidatus Absconditabacteria bacterium]